MTCKPFKEDKFSTSGIQVIELCNRQGLPRKSQSVTTTYLKLLCMHVNANLIYSLVFKANFFFSAEGENQKHWTNNWM